jgi:hypothetical protein
MACSGRHVGCPDGNARTMPAVVFAADLVGLFGAPRLGQRGTLQVMRPPSVEARIVNPRGIIRIVVRFHVGAPGHGFFGAASGQMHLGQFGIALPAVRHETHGFKQWALGLLDVFEPAANGQVGQILFFLGQIIPPGGDHGGGQCPSDIALHLALAE